MVSESLLFIPGNLGTVQDLEPAIRVKTKGSLAKGQVYLRATLREMEQILHLCESMEQNHRPLIQETKDQYYMLVDQAKFVANTKACFISLNERKAKLEQENKQRSIFRPFHFLMLKRAKHMFRDHAEALWISTIVTSSFTQSF